MASLAAAFGNAGAASLTVFERALGCLVAVFAVSATHCQRSTNAFCSNFSRVEAKQRKASQWEYAEQP